MSRYTTSAYDRLAEIIRHVFSGASMPPGLLCGLSDDDWAELFEVSARQGVLAIVWGVIKDLPAEAVPPRNVKIRWALSADSILERFEKQRQTAVRLAGLLGGEGIRMMIFKGLSLSRYYPDPCYREFGDLDVYLYDGYGKANEMMEARGIEVDYHNDKHAVFVVDGVMVENHRTITDNGNRYERYMERQLMKYADGAVLLDEGYYVPSPEFNLLFVMRHSAHHFPTSGIRLRHLLDWAMLLSAEGPAADLPAVMDIVRESGHEKFWNVYTAASQASTGIDLSRYISGDVPEADLELFLDSIVYDNTYEIHSIKGYFARTGEKLSRTFRNRRKYRLVPEKYFSDRIWRDVILSRLRNPSMIFRS